jgi:hypothetical protein
MNNKQRLGFVGVSLALGLATWGGTSHFNGKALEAQRDIPPRVLTLEKELAKVEYLTMSASRVKESGYPGSIEVYNSLNDSMSVLRGELKDYQTHSPKIREAIEKRSNNSLYANLALMFGGALTFAVFATGLWDEAATGVAHLYCRYAGRKYRKEEAV